MTDGWKQALASGLLDEPAPADPAPTKPRSDFHPTTVPDYESPFWLEGELIPSAAAAYPQANCSIRLTRGWQRSDRTIDILPVRFYSDRTKLGCTYVPNETLSELYWSSNAAPKLLRSAWKLSRLIKGFVEGLRGVDR